MLSQLKGAVWNRVAGRYLFRVGPQERIWRQYFFYNAFRALSFNGVDGDYAEFGCWGGRTFALAYGEARRHGHGADLWAFDSFEGLPQQAQDKDEHPVWVEGNLATSQDEFHAICAANGIPRNKYHVVPGFYDQTLPNLGVNGAPKNIALAYIDCDLYSSTMAVLDFLLPRLKHGMIIAFDDYFCWSANQLSGERRAQLDFFSRHPQWNLLPYIQFGWHGQSFVVEETSLLSS